jgi:hypothetical protein
MGNIDLLGQHGSMTCVPQGDLREGSDRADDADDLLTDYTYTGQRSEAALGLMYYVARW